MGESSSTRLHLRPGLVRQKVVPPGLPAATVARPRLDELYAHLLDEHGAIAAFAAAGSGKTVQAQLYARTAGVEVAWLTLDAGDRSPSRMLSYLAAAVEPFVPGAEDIVEAAFGEGLVLEEVAAALADHIDVPELMLVLDQCENIADSTRSCAVLETFLDYLSGGVRTLLLSRSEMRFSLGRLLLHGRMGRVTDADLALTREEAAALVEARGEDPGDAEQRWEAARGWIAAVAFGAPTRPGGYDAFRDLSSYLDVEVLDALPAAERRFLLDTSILDVVSLRAATAICGPRATAVWRDISLRHLPATTTADRAIVYHPCFRDFLREQLELDDPVRMRDLQRRQAALLLESAQYEDAVELLLALGDLDDAADAATVACRTLTDRADWDTFLRWADALGEARVSARPLLLGALLRAMRGARRLHEARTLSRHLDESGALAEIAAVDPGVVTHIAWSMLFEPAEALDLLDRYPGDPRAVGVRFMLETTSGLDPVPPPRGLPWRETDRLVSWALMVQGRLDDLLAMLPTDDQWPPRGPYTTPHPLFALLWRGETEHARALIEQVPDDLRRRVYTDLWHYLDAWMLLLDGDATGAVAAAEQAVVHSRRTGFGFESVFANVQGLALVSQGQVDLGSEILGEALRSSTAAGMSAYVEWSQAFLGWARLRQDDGPAALELLEASVAGMVRADRLLFLPMAAAYLAEARRRAGGGNGDAAGVDAAAGLARSAAARMGGSRVLHLAFEHVPAVLDDLIERHPDDDWRQFAHRGPVAASPRPRPRPDAVPVEVRSFGPTPDIVVDGVAANVKRVKVLELASFLAAHPGGVDRNELQVRLFPDSDRRRGSNHFRQVVHQLRKATGLTVTRVAEAAMGWSDGWLVETTDQRFEQGVRQARELSGEDRMVMLRQALALVTGPFLPASELDWASDRRFQLDVLVEEAALELAQLALDLYDYDEARGQAEAVLARNAYSEVAYRTLIRCELAVGSDAAALAAYRRSVAALREIGLEPDAATADLLRASRT